MPRSRRHSPATASASADGAELARLVLRSALGGTMLAHGVRHARSLHGTAGWFESIGFQQPRLQARLSSIVEVGAGAALITGTATPLASSAVVGTMGVAYQTVHRANGYFITDEGFEYVGFIGAAAIALAALGSGGISVDRLMGVDRLGSAPRRAALAAALGVGGAAAQLALFWRKPPAAA